MVAVLREESSRLDLLLEPDEPEDWRAATPMGIARRRGGWRVIGGELVRHPADDERGALVQHALVRYCLHGVQRQELAREVGFSVRAVQQWLTGEIGATYGDPVKRALAEAGIPAQRAATAAGTVSERKLHARLAALVRLLDEASWLLADSPWPRAARLREICRVLAAGREPLERAK